MLLCQRTLEGIRQVLRYRTQGTHYASVLNELLTSGVGRHIWGPWVFGR